MYAGILHSILTPDHNLVRILTSTRTLTLTVTFTLLRTNFRGGDGGRGESHRMFFFSSQKSDTGGDD